MEKMLSRMWRVLESPPGLIRSTADWKRLLGGDYEVAKKFLRIREGLVTSIHCHATPPCGCDHAVIVHSPDDIVSVCRCSPKRCPTTSINRLDAVIYEVNLSEFGAAIADALSIKHEERSVDGLSMTWQIGTYVPRIGLRIPLFLTVQNDSEDFKHSVTSLIAVGDIPFVLLAPTDDHWRPEYDSLLRGKNARFLALSDILNWNVKLSARQPIEKILADLLEQVLPSAAEETVFRREGDVWRIIYAGLSISLRHSTGLAYIGQLLMNPNQEIHAAMIEVAVAGTPAPLPSPTDKGQNWPEDDEYESSASTSETVPVGSYLDQQALKEYDQRITAAKEELEEAKTNNDTARIESLKREINILTKEAAHGTGLHGQLRHGGDGERARQAVSKATNRALKTIKKKHPALWQHLNSSLKIGEYLSYRPEKPISWAA